MKINHILYENIIEKELQSDASLAKKLTIMWNHDIQDRMTIAKLGPRPTTEQIVAAWLSMVDRMISKTLANGDYLKRNPHAMKWLLKQYIIGNVGFSNILFDRQIDDVIETLNMWCILLAKGVLKENHRDLNKISNLRIFDKLVDLYDIRKIRNEVELEYLMRDQLEIVLIDDSEFRVSIPLSFGACRKFNLTGHHSSFCTGSTNGINYFNKYTSKGPLIMISHKPTISSPKGKVQISPESNERQTSDGSDISVKGLEKLYPGILARIADAMTARADEINSSIREMNNSSGRYMTSSTVSILRRWTQGLKKAKK